MTKIHRNTLLNKIFFIATLMLTPTIVSSDLLISTIDDSSIRPLTSGSTGGSLSCNQNFLDLIRWFGQINANASMKPWRKAIKTYFKKSELPETRKSLASLKSDILATKPHYKRMIETVFADLVSKAPVVFNLKDQGSVIRSTAIFGMESGLKAPVSLASAVPTPKAIQEHLETYIAGQSEAISALSLLAHRFMCNKLLVDKKLAAASKPSHCVLTGPTGCGKSESLKRLGEFLKVPVLHINACSLTSEGYKGFNFSEAVANFCALNKNPKSAIVAIDEIDKLASNGAEEDDKNFGLAIQQVLLSYLDGNPVCKDKESYNIKNWWFIFTGAFSKIKGLHYENGQRETTARTHNDLIGYGFAPEFVGRLPSIISFSGHTLDTMLGVIKREDCPLSQVKSEFKQFYNVNLNFQSNALRALAEFCIKINLGVRSLHSILNVAMQPFYSAALGIPGGEINIDADDILPALEKFKKDNRHVEKNPPPFGMYL